MPRSRRPKKPSDLTGEALTEYMRVCRELEAAGRLDSADRAILALYARTWAVFHAAAERVAIDGPLMTYEHNQTVSLSPDYRVWKETARQLRGLLNDLGLTPAARSKIKAVNDEPADDLEF